MILNVLRQNTKDKIISKERINEELNKILMTNYPSIGFKLLYDSKFYQL